MSTTPWEIQRTKRRVPATVPRARKRMRLSDDLDRTAKRQQSTLTQLQFVNLPPVTEDSEDELQEIPLSPGQEVTARTKATRTRSSRSTLTQMDWFHHGGYQVEDSDEEAISPLKGISGDRIAIQQFDGSHDLPRQHKRRRDRYERRTSIPDSLGGDDGNEKSTHRAQLDGRKRIRTSNRSRKSPLPQPQRQARKAKDGQSANEKLHFSGVGNPTHVEDRSIRHNRPRVQEPHWVAETDFDVDENKLNMVPQPQTPRRVEIQEIPSSQTPRSRSYTARKSHRGSFGKSEMRSPLKERSTNIPTTFMRSNQESKAGIITPRKSQSRKICILKLPTQSTTPGARVIEDSQDESLPSWKTSDELYQDSRVLKRTHSEAHETEQGEMLEISQSSQPIASSQPESLSADPVIARRSSSKELGYDDGVRLYESHDDADSDLGSPVANDTQFNNALLNVTSSPMSLSGMNALQRDDHIHLVHSSSDDVKNTGLAGDMNIEPPFRDGSGVLRLGQEKTTPRSFHYKSSVAEASSRNNPLEIHEQGLSQQRRSNLISQGWSRVPRNNGDASPPSSGPALPSQMFTQKSAHPAALPQPSQMSTQEPTQGFPPSSLPAMQNREGHSNEIERITIKDSSSINNRLSQIPEHQDLLQLKDIDSGFGDDSEEELDNLDVDPDSPLRNSVRKSGYSKRVNSRHSRHTAVETIEQEQKSSSSPLNDDPASYLPNVTDSQLFAGSNTKTEARTHADELNALKALLDTISSSPSPPPIDTDYVRKPIPGFNNETQSNFTQDGHISAAYIHRQREAGVFPQSYVPPCIQIPDSDDDDDEASEL